MSVEETLLNKMVIGSPLHGAPQRKLSVSLLLLRSAPTLSTAESVDPNRRSVILHIVKNPLDLFLVFESLNRIQKEVPLEQN